MPEITNSESYEAAFSKNITDGVKWREEALKCALDIRKFEIELYWKRATYFWTLIAASFAGYFALQNVDAEKRNAASIFIISCIGLILSAAWHLVNRGSKYWQENWERHVDVLAEKVIGPLYRTTLSREDWAIIKPHSGFPFSVSRINQIVSLFITILWFGLAVRAFPLSHSFLPSSVNAYWTMAGFTTVFLILLLVLGWPKKKRSQRLVRFDIAEFDEVETKSYNNGVAADAAKSAANQTP